MSSFPPGPMFETEKERERVGFVIRKFLAACDMAYRRSRKGTLPRWVKEIVDGVGGSGAEGGQVGTIDFKIAPVTLLGFSGESGAVISGWKIGNDSNPLLERRAWAALLRMRPLKEFWTLELRDSHRVQLCNLLAKTWVVDPAPIPPHGVIPSLGIQSWSDAPRKLEDGRALTLSLPGQQGDEPEVVWGGDADSERWEDSLRQASDGFAEGRVATVQALPDRPDQEGQILIG